MAWKFGFAPVKYLRSLSIRSAGTAPINSPNPPSWPNIRSPAVASVSRCGLAAHPCCVCKPCLVGNRLPRRGLRRSRLRCKLSRQRRRRALPSVRFLAHRKCLWRHSQSIPKPKSDPPGATHCVFLAASRPGQPRFIGPMRLSTARQRFVGRSRAGQDLHYSVDMGARLAGGDAPDCC